MIERKFRIVAIRSLNEHITIELAPIVKEKPILRPEKIIQPKFSTEEAKIGYEMGQAMIQGMSQAGMGQMPRPPMRTIPAGTITLELSKAEYEEIGEPTVNRIITLKIEVKIT